VHPELPGQSREALLRPSGTKDHWQSSPVRIDGSALGGQCPSLGGGRQLSAYSVEKLHAKSWREISKALEGPQFEAGDHGFPTIARLNPAQYSTPPI